MSAAFGEQARALADAGADAIVVETMSDLAEAKLAVQAVRATGLPVVACMVFDSGKNRDRTMMGTTPEQAAEELTAAGADAVGANCGNGIEGYVPVCRRLAARHLVADLDQAQRRPSRARGRPGRWYRTTPNEFAAHVPALLEAARPLCRRLLRNRPGVSSEPRSQVLADAT